MRRGGPLNRARVMRRATVRSAPGRGEAGAVIGVLHRGAVVAILRQKKVEGEGVCVEVKEEGGPLQVNQDRLQASILVWLRC